MELGVSCGNVLLLLHNIRPLMVLKFALFKISCRFCGLGRLSRCLHSRFMHISWDCSSLVDAKAISA